MTEKLDLARIRALHRDAQENIESYLDPDTPKALEQFTAKMKAILLADPQMLDSVPEYLPMALYGRVKFPPAAKSQWQSWLQTGKAPHWDQFKTAIAFANADLELVKAVRAYSQSLLIEACAVLFMLDNASLSAVSRNSAPAEAADQDANDGDNYADDYADDDSNDDYDSDDSDEEGYDDQYDNIRFKGE
ncbi:cold adaptation protein AtcA [Rheinheimera nanhaiensis]|uniref:Uncharacterized protein n=1 Tax=Rheinheimera nanhaiensis E407-8 TaxID=562729 RepID=I1DU61_9GAMM|nr:hypothetical protein [Rheinheimera nanhaiensis]GAB57589.1 hypothetical protein RNAN_0558 [Rheinheimera nanhaiensis E407-8]